MRRSLIIVAAVVGVLAVAVLLIGALSPSDEVVTLVTQDAEGEMHETPLWVVDVEGVPWLRAGNPDAAWVEQLRDAPTVEVVRGDRTTHYEAEFVADAPTREHINELMNQKYGASDSLVGLFTGRSQSLPIRLNRRDVAAGGK